MPGGLVGQGAEFSRSSCALVELTARQPKRVSIATLSLRRGKKKNPACPSLPHRRDIWPAARTYSNSHSTRNIRSASLRLPLLNTSQRLCGEASSTHRDVGSFFTSCTFRPKKTREGRRCHFGSVIISCPSSTRVRATARRLVSVLHIIVPGSVCLSDLPRHIQPASGSLCTFFSKVWKRP